MYFFMLIIVSRLVMRCNTGRLKAHQTKYRAFGTLILGSRLQSNGWLTDSGCEAATRHSNEGMYPFTDAYVGIPQIPYQLQSMFSNGLCYWLGNKSFFWQNVWGVFWKHSAKISESGLNQANVFKMPFIHDIKWGDNFPNPSQNPSWTSMVFTIYFRRHRFKASETPGRCKIER